MLDTCHRPGRFFQITNQCHQVQMNQLGPLLSQSWNLGHWRLVLMAANTPKSSSAAPCGGSQVAIITRLARSVKALKRDHSSMDEVQLIIYNWKSQGAFFWPRANENCKVI